MNGCPEYEEILLLDVHRELDPESRTQWERHLRACAACNEERSRMLRFMGRVKEVMVPPPLPHEESARVAKALRAQMNRFVPERGWGWQWLVRPWRMGPALATICLLVAIFSIWRFGAFDSFMGRENPVKDSSQGIRPEDAEIIRNLDFLKQMDTVEKLVRTLDAPDEDNPSPKGNSNTQGMTTHEERHHFG